MAQSVIGSLRVNLGLDSAKFQNGARKLDQPLNRMKRQFFQIATIATGMGVAIGAAALAGAKQIDETAKSARRLDASIGGFRALELAASEAGVSLSSLTNDIQTMNRELASIGVSGNGARALDALGLSISDIEGLDADEKLAVIADQVQKLGLDAGQTTAILRDLGVRNREMALLVLQGGDAIRSARNDIADYGLEISKVDADRIEAANDAIGRLGLITQYAGQQLAIALVPAMGRLAEVMTDSLREGGLLRTAIDGLANNIDVLAYSAGVAVTAFGVRYVGALVASKIATFSLVGALASLKAALIATGIGALVVGAGYLIAKFADLSRAAGGFGNAMGLLRDLAIEVFTKMGQAGSAFLSVNKAVALGIGSAFTNAFRVIAVGWDKLINGMATAWNTIATTGVGESLGLGEMGSSDVAGRLGQAADDMASRGVEAAAAAGRALSNARAPLESLTAIKDVMSEVAEESETASDSAVDLSEELESAGGAAGGAASSLAKTAEVAAETASAFNNNLVGAVNGVADAFAEWTVNGFKDFKSMTESIFDTFKNMLKNMIATAAANKITVALGLGGSGVAGGGGLLGNLLGGGASGGGLLGGVGGLAGLSSAFSGGMGFLTSGLASGGLSGGASAIGTALAGAGGGLGGLAAAAGAVALPVAAIAAAVSFFSTKTKTIDAGIRATVTIEDAMFESFKQIEKSKYWGLSKSKSTSYKELSAAQSDPLVQAVQQVQQGVIGAADSLGFSDAIFDSFRTRFKISLRGLSEDARQEKIANAFEKLGSKMADMVPGLDAYALASETSLDALNRLSTALLTVNDVFRDLGFSLYNTSLAGADGAEQFANLFGSLEQFTSATAAYYDQFYSDEEKLANATGRLSEVLADLGINVMPATNEAFRALVDTAMLAGDSDLAAELIQLAPAFDSVTDSAAALRAELLNVNEDAFATGIDYQRALSRAANGIEYTPGQADIVAKLDAMIAAQALAQSTAEITAANTGKAADNTEGSLLIAEESLL